ncbi:MAG: pyridoxal phosphate-dependent aminotransferase [Candidatus Limnocylindrales bacterium]
MTRFTAVTHASPTNPAGYSWEATNDEVAARYGLALEDIVRFDLNTSPAPPELAERILAAGRFESPISEYAPSDYRRLVAAAAARYDVAPDEILVGAGADEILDIIGKTYLPAGGAAVVPIPTYAMYRVITEQRGATVIAVPRQGPEAGYAIDLDAVTAAAETADVVWLCSPNNPTAMAEPPGTIADLLAHLAATASAGGRPAPIVVVDEAYFEFVGTSEVHLRATYPNLIVIRTASKAYGLAGLRVGFALATPEVITRMNPYRPPGSVSTVSATIVTETLLADDAPNLNLERVRVERGRLGAALRAFGWDVGPSVTNFLLVDFGSPERAELVADGLLRRGLVPRTFAAGHPLADHLRLTVRSAAENDRLIEVARQIEEETPG